MNDRKRLIVIFTHLVNEDQILKLEKEHAGEFHIVRCSIDDPDLSDSVDTINRILSPTVAALPLMHKQQPNKTKGPKPSPNASKNPFSKNNKPAGLQKSNQRFAKAGRGR